MSGRVASRRFPPPWEVEETPACFIVKDQSGQELAYVYCEDEPRPAVGGEVADDEARRIAANPAHVSLIASIKHRA
jgi:hypothetical protein